MVLTCDIEVTPLPATGQDVGIDLGLSDFLVTDTGEAVPNPRPLRKAEERLATAQRALQRKKRGSHRRAKQRGRFARQCQRVANVRKDFHHKTARALVRANDTIYHEDLAVRNMVQNRNPAVQDCAWSQFIAILRGKAAEAGHRVIAVNPRGTSQTCVCGEPAPKDLSERWHQCPHCHLSLPRDQVSAMIVKGLGRSLQANAA